jgi:hypothetical protein
VAVVPVLEHPAGTIPHAGPADSSDIVVVSFDTELEVLVQVGAPGLGSGQ